MHEILPLVRARWPEARFTIVGSSPTRAVERLAEVAGVRVTGFVPDTRSELARAAVAVAPLRIARGIQNKVLEALAMGLPVVGTTPATQGVEGEAGRDFQVADDAASFAARVVELLERPDEARALGQRGRAFVERQYDWENVLAPLEPLLERCASARAKSG